MSASTENNLWLGAIFTHTHTQPHRSSFDFRAMEWGVCECVSVTIWFINQNKMKLTKSEQRKLVFGRLSHTLCPNRMRVRLTMWDVTVTVHESSVCVCVCMKATRGSFGKFHLNDAKCKEQLNDDLNGRYEQFQMKRTLNENKKTTSLFVSAFVSGTAPSTDSGERAN